MPENKLGFAFKTVSSRGLHCQCSCIVYGLDSRNEVQPARDMICRNHTGKSALSAIPTTTLHHRRCRRHGMLWQSLSRTSTNSTFHDCKSVSNCTPVCPHESLNPARRQRACGYGGGGVPALATWAVLKGGRACGGSLVLIFLA